MSGAVTDRKKKRHPYGIFILPTGSKYCGERDEDGNISGKGVCQYKNGDIYLGFWSQNTREGKGKYTFANGDVYEGDWLDNKMTGKGTYKWANGESYSGYWFDGHMLAKI